MDSETNFINIIQKAVDTEQQNNGSRNGKKCKVVEDWITEICKECVKDKVNYSVHTRYDVPSCNSSGLKNCDIVIKKDNSPFIIIPFKQISNSYKKNKNNYFENLTGEVLHLHWKDANYKIIPFNVINSIVPAKTNSGTKHEKVTYKDISCYKHLENNKIVHKVLTYIMNVEPNNIYHITSINTDTPYVSLTSILNLLIQ